MKLLMSVWYTLYRVGQGTGIVKALLVVVFTFYKTIDGAAVSEEFV